MSSLQTASVAAAKRHQAKNSIYEDSSSDSPSSSSTNVSSEESVQETFAVGEEVDVDSFADEESTCECSVSEVELKEGMLTKLTQDQEDLASENSIFAMDGVLPCSIGGLRLQKLSWEDFRGNPDQRMRWSAHVYWGISYTYIVRQKTSTYKKVIYQIIPEVQVWMRPNSWTKKQVAHLLNHEQGHYLIGCFCALEFKKQALQFRFTDNYRFEIIRLFNKILKEYILLEKRYDKETCHRLERQQQLVWDKLMLAKTKEYSAWFAKQDKK